MSTLADLRRSFHQQICQNIIRVSGSGVEAYPNFADKGNRISREIAWKIVENLGYVTIPGTMTGQQAGKLFEDTTENFIETAFGLLHHLRPGRWRYSTTGSIADFDQYAHLAYLQDVVKQNAGLKAALGEDYIITPDIVISREPITDAEINIGHDDAVIIDKGDPYAQHAPLRITNAAVPRPLLHASISCKWTVRSDRAQNTRTEALNLIRNRKGNLPHVMIVTAEPQPTRIASLALGTGDVDCVYHFALNELEDALKALNNEDQLDMLMTLVKGRRLRDISDLPFDLAI